MFKKAKGGLGSRFNFAHLVGGKEAGVSAESEEEEEVTEATEEPDEEEAASESDDSEEDETETSEDDEESAEASHKAALQAAEKRGAARERERCATIFASKEAAGRVETAAELAFGTDLDAETAIKVLGSTGKGGGKLVSLMSEEAVPALGGEGGVSAKTGDDAVVSGFVSAYQKATGRQQKQKR